MSESIKFDPKKLAKLNNPERLKWINPYLIWETVGLNNSAILIDIGAGTGFFAKEFAKVVSDGKIYACDTSEIMIKWMKEHLIENNIIQTLCAESSIDLESEIADLVYMINVHHELIEPEKLLKEAYRLLKIGGKIAIIDWKKVEMEDGPPLKIRVCKDTIVKQLGGIGFKNIIDYDILPLHSLIIAQK